MARVRFMLVSAPRASTMQWPGTWFSPPGIVGASNPPWCAWRLLSGNNRELGRSFATYPDAVSCSNAVSELCSTLPDAQATVVAGLRTGLWHWEIDVHGTPTAISARSFTAQRECQHNFEQFVAGVSLVRRKLTAVETAS